MVTIQGTLQVVPVSVSTESATIQSEGQPPQPVVVQNLVTNNGVVQVVFPLDAIDGVVEGLKGAQAQANNKEDLYVPSSMQEVEEIAKVHKKVVGSDEIRGSK